MIWGYPHLWTFALIRCSSTPGESARFAQRWGPSCFRWAAFYKTGNSCMTGNELEGNNWIFFISINFWLVVGPPLWKIWVRQLGWWLFAIDGNMEKMATKPPTRFFRSRISPSKTPRSRRVQAPPEITWGHRCSDRTGLPPVFTTSPLNV